MSHTNIKSHQIALLTIAILSFCLTGTTFAASYSIIYDDNVVSNMPTDVSDKTYGTTVSVTSTIPTRSDFHSIGWCSVIPTYINGTDTCTGGTQYSAGDNLTIDQTSPSNNFHLYAMWKTDTLYMQYVSEWGSTVRSGQEVTAVDIRDNKTYTVARLDDGNLWMTQNLDYNIVNGGANLNSANTDVPSNWADAGTLINTSSPDNYYGSSSESAPYSYDPGDRCWDGGISTSYSGSIAYNTTTCTSSNIHYHIGTYYNWTAAVAMSDSSSYITDNTDVDQSICPAGWTLPKSGSDTSSGSFAYLIDEASLTSGTSGNIHTSPYYFVYGGADHGIQDVGNMGYYWSSVVEDDYYAYSLIFDDYDTVRPADNASRYDTISVRCIAR